MHAAHGEAGQLYQRGVGHLLRPEDQQRRILQKVADANGRDEHAQRRRLAQGLIGAELDDHAQHRAYRDADDHRHPRGQSHLRHRHNAAVCAHHDHVAVGEVQHFGDAVDHGVAQRDQRVDAPQAQPAY